MGCGISAALFFVAQHNSPCGNKFLQKIHWHALTDFYVAYENHIIRFLCVMLA